VVRVSLSCSGLVSGFVPATVVVAYQNFSPVIKALDSYTSCTAGLMH
jgi:hypothetical protein